MGKSFLPCSFLQGYLGFLGPLRNLIYILTLNFSKIVLCYYQLNFSKNSIILSIQHWIYMSASCKITSLLYCSFQFMNMLCLFMYIELCVFLLSFIIFSRIILSIFLRFISMHFVFFGSTLNNSFLKILIFLFGPLHRNKINFKNNDFISSKFSLNFFSI